MKTKLTAIICSLLRLIAILFAVLFLILFFSPICYQKGEMDYFLMCMLVGIGKAIILFPPVKCDLGTAMGILVLDCLIGGMVGFVVLCVEIIRCVIKAIATMFM